MVNKFKSRKVSDYQDKDFTETLKFEVLACGNVTENNNKFYCLELQFAPKEDYYRLFTHYGRVGKTNIYEVRDTINGNIIENSDLPTLEAEYLKILKKKKSPSKGYTLVDTQEPSVGSSNIRNTKVTTSTGGSKGDLKILSLFSDSITKSMVKMIWKENIHNITNMTTMSVSSSGISSPLGPLTLSHLEKATGILNDIQRSFTLQNNEILDLNNQYFSMIPHPFGMKIPSDSLIDDDNKFMTEFDLLDQMKSVLKVTDDKKDAPVQDIGVDIEVISDTQEAEDLERQYLDSRASCHRHLNGWQINEVFKVNHRDSTNNYKVNGEEYVLFHGSRACNILSIMMNGLIVPPKTAGHVTGRMFGDGVYAASASTKALNYATGYWNRSGNDKYKFAYMFVVKFAMGKIYYPTRQVYSGAPDGYDSIWAKKEETNLANDEFIVYDTSQAKITHLLQLKEK